MEKGAWQPTVHGVPKEMGHDLAIKQQQVLITRGKKPDAYGDLDLLLF